MATATLLVFFSLFHLCFIKSVDSTCPKSFHCGDRLGFLEFPLSDSRQPECGLFMVNCTDSTNPRIQLGDGGTWYRLKERVSSNYKLLDPLLQNDLNNSNLCLSLRNLSFPNSPSSSLTFFPNLTLFICDDTHENAKARETIENYKNYSDCGGFTVYYRQPTHDFHTGQSSMFQGCTTVHMPIKSNQETGDLLNLLSAEFTLEWNVSSSCISCHSRGGQCLANSLNEFQCKDKRRSTVVLAAAISGGSVFIVLCLFVFFVIYNRKKRTVGAYLRSRNKSFGPFSKSDVEGGSFNFGITIFSYTELVEATNNFDSSKELGDGGYGTVYYGKLRDGREVAIKRLYEHNYRRVEQFRNEIKILTCLRHPNLVSLYGCTSRRSHELLLVYGYVPNGTVADHLHGESAKKELLTWDIRMNIAIETASALAYLHKSVIIHRDVKTDNILLDKNFCVKVADFGLSRLFPIDVTHISTAPQGTPGYVDPEYHQCYQLTDKSDVYSFGVVLIELISSMPAVDISRHKHEINLANLAVNKIQKCAFDELIDSTLGYGTDTEITRMTTSVAELAFQCLQLANEFRPSMYEVLEVLMGIRNGEEYKFEKIEDPNGVPKSIPPSPETDNIVLLKNKKFQSSPTAVTDIWISGSPSTSSIG